MQLTFNCSRDINVLAHESRKSGDNIEEIVIYRCHFMVFNKLLLSV